MLSAPLLSLGISFLLHFCLLFVDFIYFPFNMSLTRLKTCTLSQEKLYDDDTMYM
jgi:hypothetical protein